MKASLLIFMNGTVPLQILALCWVLIRFIATIIRVSISIRGRVRVRVRVRVIGLVTLGLRFLGLRQPRVRVKFRLRVLIILACYVRIISPKRTTQYT